MTMVQIADGEISLTSRRRWDADSFAEYVSDLGKGRFVYDINSKDKFPNEILLRKANSDEITEVYNAGRLEIARSGTLDHDGNSIPEKYFGYARKLGEVREVARDAIERALKSTSGEVNAIGLTIVPVDTLEDDYYKMINRRE